MHRPNAALFVAMIFVAALLSSCSKPAGGGQHATVSLLDGTQVSGTVLANSPSQIQIAGDDKITRTIPMSQVRTIDYSQPAPAAGPAAQTAPAPNAPNPASNAAYNTPPGVPGGAPASAPPPAPNSQGYHPLESAVTTTTHEVPAGAHISVRTEETIDSSKAVDGQTFPADVTQDVLDANGAVVIPRGANAEIVIRSVSKGGHFRGAPDLVMDLGSVSIDGRRYELSTSNVARRGRSGIGKNKRTGEYTGGGAAFGAIVGAIAGGGKGAAIGAGAGAGAGALTQVFTRGKIKVPVETVLTFRLDEPLSVEAAQ